MTVSGKCDPKFERNYKFGLSHMNADAVITFTEQGRVKIVPRQVVEQ